MRRLSRLLRHSIIPWIPNVYHFITWYALSRWKWSVDNSLLCFLSNLLSCFPWCHFSPSLFYFHPSTLFFLSIQFTSTLLTLMASKLPPPPPPFLFLYLPADSVSFLPHLCLQSHILLSPSCAEGVCVALHGLRAPSLIGSQSTGNTTKLLNSY